jgi:hypothetical protein
MGGNRGTLVDKSPRRILKGRGLSEESATPHVSEAQVEALAQRIIDVITAAEPSQRPVLRQYALDLLRDGTETVDVQPAAAHRAAGDGNPLGIALLLGMFSLPMLLLFFPVGLTLLAVAVVLGVWGLVAMVFRR